MFILIAKKFVGELLKELVKEVSSWYLQSRSLCKSAKSRKKGFSKMFISDKLLISPTPMPLKVVSTVPQVPRRNRPDQPAKIHNTKAHA